MAHLLEQVLVADGHFVWLVKLGSPLRHKRRDLVMPPLQELLNRYENSATRETLLIAVPESSRRP